MECVYICFKGHEMYHFEEAVIIMWPINCCSGFTLAWVTSWVQYLIGLAQYCIMAMQEFHSSSYQTAFNIAVFFAPQEKRGDWWQNIDTAAETSHCRTGVTNGFSKTGTGRICIVLFIYVNAYPSVLSHCCSWCASEVSGVFFFFIQVWELSTKMQISAAVKLTFHGEKMSMEKRKKRPQKQGAQILVLNTRETNKANLHVLVT